MFSKEFWREFLKIEFKSPWVARALWFMLGIFWMVDTVQLFQAGNIEAGVNGVLIIFLLAIIVFFVEMNDESSRLFKNLLKIMQKTNDESMELARTAVDVAKEAEKRADEAEAKYTGMLEGLAANEMGERKKPVKKK
jgi:uncharacterized membrane protein